MIIQIKSNKQSVDFVRNNENIVCQLVTNECKKAISATIIVYYGMLNTFYFISKDVEALRTAYSKILEARAYNFTDLEDGLIVIEIEEDL